MSEIKELEESSIFIDVNDSATQNIDYNNCENYKNITFDMLNLSGVGRFLNVNTTIKKVCPNKQIAVGFKLYETTSGSKVMKGYKTFAVQHSENSCADITLSNIQFVLPEEIAETKDKTNLCSARTFELEIISHYVDLLESRY